MQALKALVRRLPLCISIYAVLGFVLRYMQRKNELLPDGSIAEGAICYKLLPLAVVLFGIGIAVILWGIDRHRNWNQLYQNKLLSVFSLCASGVLLLGNILLLISEQEPVSVYVSSAPEFAAFLNNLLPWLGIVAAICAAFHAYQCYSAKKPSPLLYMCLSLYLAVRLVVCFQAWNTDPSIHNYCYTLLAGICSMLATFHFAGFSFDKGKRRMGLFWLSFACVFNAITLADAIYDSDLGALLLHFALLLLCAIHSLQLIFAKEQ